MTIFIKILFIIILLVCGSMEAGYPCALSALRPGIMNGSQKGQERARFTSYKLFLNRNKDDRFNVTTTKQRETLMDCLNGKTIGQIARKKGVTRSEIKRRIYEGIAAIKKSREPDSDYSFVLKNKDSLPLLPSRQERVLTGFFIKGKTEEEIAGEMSITRSNVLALKRRGVAGLKAMRDPLTDYAIVKNNMPLLDELNVREKKVLTSFFVDQKPPGQIAEDMDITKGGVSYLKIRALKKLRDWL